MLRLRAWELQVRSRLLPLSCDYYRLLPLSCDYFCYPTNSPLRFGNRCRYLHGAPPPSRGGHGWATAAGGGGGGGGGGLGPHHHQQGPPRPRHLHQQGGRHYYGGGGGGGGRPGSGPDHALVQAQAQARAAQEQARAAQHEVERLRRDAAAREQHHGQPQEQQASTEEWRQYWEALNAYNARQAALGLPQHEYGARGTGGRRF